MQTWQLKSNNQESFTLTFDYFDVEHSRYDHDEDGFLDCDNDYVLIDGGASTDIQPDNKKHCNYVQAKPGPNPGPFTSVLSGTEMTVKFKSNDRRSNTGFLGVVCCDVNITTDMIGMLNIPNILETIIVNVILIKFKQHPPPTLLNHPLQLQCQALLLLLAAATVARLTDTPGLWAGWRQKSMSIHGR